MTRLLVLVLCLLLPLPASSAEASAGTEGGLPSYLSSEERRQIEIFRAASRSVVHINTASLRRGVFTLDVFEVPRGSGSGFVWDDAGHIVTNFHVIEGASSVEVTFQDGSVLEAELVGVAPDKDLAVLRVRRRAARLEPLALGGSADLLVGQSVMAVGNPFGLDHSLSVGVVSALGRELRAPNGRSIRDVIQTDAAINPGNSGGPLLDSRGHLVGVNSAIYSPSGASVGIGFAVPVDTVRRLVPQLIEHGRVIQPGIQFLPLADRVARQYGLQGVVVREVMQGGAAQQAGITGMSQQRDASGRWRTVLGDQIVAVDGVAVESGDDLLHAFEKKGVGNVVELRVRRDGKERSVRIALVRVR